MKTEDVSQFVTRVNLDQHSNACARDRAHVGICSVHYIYIGITKVCSVYFL